MGCHQKFVIFFLFICEFLIDFTLSLIHRHPVLSFFFTYFRWFKVWILFTILFIILISKPHVSIHWPLYFALWRLNLLGMLLIESFHLLGVLNFVLIVLFLVNFFFSSLHILPQVTKHHSNLCNFFFRVLVCQLFTIFLTKNYITW